ncbi:MAG: zinc-ribbon domain-containing protein [Nostoc sp. DedQUE05]|uniref:zinc-ribbon domain-containing protein n=1 Tax=Nostoc sp. DedQUE05 TaxID=3075391 RepID=UPI002AD4F5BA|nr:zinc-ribbon domain-containing protein [Nostoc sp. DedQUE05]MDZ8091723.1 zinc-ribbon domain-containing protein [Nostoc sp. DedQUE05]
MKCPQCQTENRANSRFCINCGSSLNVNVSLDDGSRGHRPPSTAKRYPQGKDPILAAILSFILPGIAIGQFYNGDVKKGLVMLVGAIILGSTDFKIMGIAIWVWSVIDAYQVAKGNRNLWN